MVNNWCPTCDESCTDHPTVCTICGDTLQTAPEMHGSAAARPAIRSATAGAAVIPVELAAALSAGGGAEPNQENLRAIMETFSALRESDGVPPQGAGVDTDWERPPPEALDPSMAQPKSRATSKACLARIPRIKVEKRSAILHEGSVEILPPPPSSCGRGPVSLKRGNLCLNALMGEFGLPPPFSVTGRLVLCQPPTGKGGLLPDTENSLSQGRSYGGTVAFMERGGSTTFAAKALMAQRAGASALVVGNNVGVWPYIMKDSTDEGSKGGLTIPVVMVKRSDGVAIRKLAEESGDGSVRCTVNVKPIGGESTGVGGCVVCRENFIVGDTVLRLPFCAHSFHERCALSWLERHNTCPYCRRELPTDDEEYERERRRVSRTHGGTAGGEVEDESRWESLFG